MQHDTINIAQYIDHTLLKANATREQVRRLCEEALKFSFASVCVNPCRVPLVYEILKGSSVKTCTVIGFPLGATSTEIKLFEADWCLEHGAQELDMVINIGEALSGNWKTVENEIAKLADLAHSKNAILKVIFENCLLSKEDIVIACNISVATGADFVKTSTGFSSGGATTEDVKLMSKTVAGKCGVKASGGIRNAEQALAMLSAGATRLGTSAGVAIVTGINSESGY